VSGDGWTIDELAWRVAEALASEGVRAPNGRVSPAPDRRAIRWYATIGLLDPPLRTRGRTARYGERHLLQLVAVKRRQAEGHSLAAIQAELAGATDASLRRVAALPAGSGPTGSPDRAAPGGDAGAAAIEHRESPAAGERRHFWRAPAIARLPSVAGSDPASSDLAGPEPTGPGFASPGPSPAPGQPYHSPVRILDSLHRPLPAGPAPGPVAPVYPVPLHPAATLTLPSPPSEDDLAAIHTAARPLLDLLADRGLLPDPPDPPDPTDPPDPSDPLARRPA
jgi:DNA-binding transcriptional MerR regulator